MPTLTETIHQGAYIVSEAPGFQSRDTILISTVAAILSGTVMMKPGVPGAETATATAAVDNVGNGTLTLDPVAPTTAKAIDGEYTVNFTAPTTFEVLDPAGKIKGKGTVGQTYVGTDLKFTIAAGATAFAQNDRITIVVLRPDVAGDAPVPLDATGEASGVLFTEIVATAPAKTIKAVVHARNCEVRASDLTWPAGFSPSQLAEATLQLKRRGIILR